MAKLTSRQQEILDFIRNSLEVLGAPPTRAEIAQAFGFASHNAAEEHLKALAKKGLIVLEPGSARGIRLVEQLGPEQAAEMANKPGDGTHFNEKGARAMADLIMQALPAAAPQLKPLLRTSTDTPAREIVRLWPAGAMPASANGRSMSRRA